MELVDYLRVLRRRWRVIALCLLAGLLAGWVTAPSEDPAQQRPTPIGTSYRATHTLLQAADAPTAANLELVRLFAKTGEIPKRAAVRLGRPPEEGPVLAAGVNVVVDAEVGSLAVTVAGSDGERAAAVANAFATEIVENLRATAQRDRDAEQKEASRLVEVLGGRVAQLQREIDQAGESASPLLQAQLDAYLQNYSTAFARLQSLGSLGAARSPLVTLEQAVPVPVVASSPFSPPSSRSGRTGMAALLGLLCGVVLALVLERVDRRLRTREEMEDVTSLPVVAEVPVLPRRARRDWSVSAVTAPAGAVAEAYRSLRSAIMLVRSRGPVADGVSSEREAPRVLLITSPLPSDGKSTTVANLAACFAESGRQVLVLDCDFRNPTLHRYLNVQTGRGISDLLAGTSAGELRDVVRTSSVRGVRLVTSGTVTDHPAALLARAGALLDAARRLADVVLIDAAPVLSANDATDLVPYVDSVVLVTRSGRTTRDHASRATELLARLSVPIAGTVLVASNGSLRGYAARRLRLGRLLGSRRRSIYVSAGSVSAAAIPRQPRARHRTGAPAATERSLSDAHARYNEGTGWPNQAHTQHADVWTARHVQDRRPDPAGPVSLRLASPDRDHVVITPSTPEKEDP